MSPPSRDAELIGGGGASPAARALELMARPRAPLPAPGRFYQLRLSRRAGPGRAGRGAGVRPTRRRAAAAPSRGGAHGAQRTPVEPRAPSAGSKTGQAPPRGRRPPAGTAGEAPAAGTERDGRRAARGARAGVAQAGGELQGRGRRRTPGPGPGAASPSPRGDCVYAGVWEPKGTGVPERGWLSLWQAMGPRGYP